MVNQKYRENFVIFKFQVYHKIGHLFVHFFGIGFGNHRNVNIRFLSLSTSGNGAIQNNIDGAILENSGQSKD